MMTIKEDNTLQAVLERVARGTSTERDAQFIKDMLMPDSSWEIVGAHLCLMCNWEQAKILIAPDLRQELARRLTEDIR